MKILFGMALDAGGWPDLLRDRPAVAGEVMLGPAGLLGVLETRLGLGGRPSPQALRVRQMMQRMQSLDDGNRFYSRSFRADPWACARALLGWRDELVESGWDAGPDQGGQERLETLAELERSGDPLAPGVADRLREVNRALERNATPRIESIRLFEPPELLPSPWRALFTRLEGVGVCVEQIEEAPTDIHPEVTLLRGGNEWSCAVLVAGWLAAGTDGNDAVTLLCQGDTTALDHQLHRLGLPAPGRSGNSAHRDLLQLLPLAIDNLWQPVRVEKLVELLLLPHSPVPGFAARILVDALCKEPGLGGRAWDKALERIATSHARYREEKGMAPEEAQAAGREMAGDLDRWLRASRQESGDAIDSALVRGVVERVRNHLARIAWKEPLAASALSHCDDLLEVLGAVPSVDRPMLSRMLDEIIGTGTTGTQVREAAPWGVIDSPGQLLGETGVLVWWPCTDPQEQVEWRWSESELQALAERGVIPEPPEQRRERESWWLQRLAASCHRLLLVLPERAGGETPRHHPVVDLLRYQLKVEIEEADAAALPGCRQPCLAGRELRLAVMPPVEVPPPSPVRQIRGGAFTPPGSLSPSSLGSLLGCPFHWLLERQGIEATGLQGLPTGNLPIGTLAHRVMEEVFRDGLPASADDAARRAGEAFDRLLPVIDSELLLPENDLMRRRTRRQVTEAAADLLRLLERLWISGQASQ